MTPKEFFDKVSRMRKAQKEYFRTRYGRALSDSKRLEQEIDDEEYVTNMDIPAVLPLSDEYDQSDNPRLITVRYSSEENTQASWVFDSVMPHATFMLYHEGKATCKGIVIDLDEIDPVK